MITQLSSAASLKHKSILYPPEQNRFRHPVQILLRDMMTCAERLKSAVELVDPNTSAFTHSASMRDSVLLRGWVDF
ncbi:hypothetical protein BDD12DRAFT_832881 [Trichophaea hybrida]|nr:hypothetical protein BDD12DRAFT_832881 [Trichophaea hybrida]